jgi:hypothetical protein
LKQALVTPVLKRSDLDSGLQSNYRPISNLPIAAKVLERVAARRLNEHIETVNALDPFQSAYRANFSTETALIKVISDFASVLDDGHAVVLISLDISSAFDTVCHEILLSRLAEAGVEGKALQWFSSYLSERYQTVVFKEERSMPVKCLHGVPQGSVLGPILFNLYVAPLGRYLTENGINHHIYADDILIYMTLTGSYEIDTTVEKLYQTALDYIADWLIKQRLAINAAKTQCLLLQNRRSRAYILPLLQISNLPLAIQTTGTLKYLGVHIDAHLEFKTHVNKVCQSVYLQLRMLRHIRSSLTVETATLLCNALVLSRVDYCGTIFHLLALNQQAKLQKTLNVAARITLCANRFCHASPLLKKLNWLKFPERSKFRALCLIHKIVYGSAPKYLRDELVLYIPPRSLRSSGQCLLQRIVPNRDVGKKAIRTFGPHLWNELAETTRKTQKQHSFENDVFNYLCDN